MNYETLTGCLLVILSCLARWISTPPNSKYWALNWHERFMLVLSIPSMVIPVVLNRDSYKLENWGFLVLTLLVALNLVPFYVNLIDCFAKRCSAPLLLTWKTIYERNESTSMYAFSRQEELHANCSICGKLVDVVKYEKEDLLVTPSVLAELSMHGRLVAMEVTGTKVSRRDYKRYRFEMSATLREDFKDEIE